MAVVALFCCAAACGQPKPTSMPTSRPVSTQVSPPETVAAAHLRLSREKADQLSEQGIVLKTALAFVLALGRAEGPRAAELIDAVGYEVLPLAGELPEDPSKPLGREEIGKRVQARQRAALEALPAGDFQVLDREAVRKIFPAVATWMLPTDWAVVMEPNASVAWIGQRCCLVIRLRARKPAVLGGNLLEVLKGG